MEKPVIEILKTIAENIYGSDLLKSFEDQFLTTDYSHQLNSSTLFFPGRHEQNICDISQVGTPNKISRLSIRNKSSFVPLSLGVKFDVYTYEELFDRLAISTMHNNWMFDFRENPYLAKLVLSGPRYFLFHGDGNCLLLNLIFLKMTSIYFQNKLDLYYVSTKSRNFMHVYCEERGKIIDLDQKQFKVESGSGYPAASIHMLYQNAGVIFYLQKKIFFDSILPSCSRSALSSVAKTLRSGAEILAGFGASPLRVERAFLEANRRRQRINLLSDDFDWKNSFKNFKFFKDHLNNIDIKLGVGEELNIGFDSKTPLEVLFLCVVYFGRIPMRISQLSSQYSSVNVILPEIPWLIAFPKEVTCVFINGVALTPLVSDLSGIAYVGARQLEESNCLFCEILRLRVCVGDMFVQTQFQVFVPFNGFGLNSGIIDLKIPKGYEIKVFRNPGI